MSSEEVRKDAYLKTDILAEMARAQASLGDVSGALNTIREALVLSDHVFSFFLTLDMIVRKQEKIADEITLNEALDLAERMSAELLAKENAKGRIGNFELTWRTNLAEAQARRGRREKADQTLQSAIDLISSDAFDQ
jgi:Flp pilus assembly protein TadD